MSTWLNECGAPVGTPIAKDGQLTLFANQNGTGSFNERTLLFKLDQVIVGETFLRKTGEATVLNLSLD